jgi:hypothetical protein
MKVFLFNDLFFVSFFNFIQLIPKIKKDENKIFNKIKLLTIIALTISLLHFLKALIAFERDVFDCDITNVISFSSIP